VLSITPRIIRMQPRPSSDATEFWYGTETPHPQRPLRRRLRRRGARRAKPGRAPAPTGSALPPEVAATARERRPGCTTRREARRRAPRSPIRPQWRPRPALRPPPHRPGLPSTSLPATVPSNNPPAAAAASGAASSASSALTLEGPSETTVGEEFKVTVRLATDQSITHLRSQLRFDSSALQLVSASPGDMVPGGQRAAPRWTPAAAARSWTLRRPRMSRCRGSGSLMVLQFKALTARSATNIMAMMNVLGGAGAAVGNSSAPPLKIAIQAAATLKPMRTRGFTLIELVITLAIVGLMATAAMPLAQLVAKREKESELRAALRDIPHRARCLQAGERHRPHQQGAGRFRLPAGPEIAVRGVEDAASEKKVMMYFLRRVPRDPFFPDGAVPGEDTWGLRSFADSAR